MKLLDRLDREIHEAFALALDEAFFHVHARHVESYFDLDVMQLRTAPTDPVPFTAEQSTWIKAFSAGYFTAHRMVRTAADRTPKR